MALEEQIMAEMKEAMKAKNEGVLRSLRAIKAEIIKAKTDPGAGGQIDEATEQKFLQKMMKQRRDSLEIFEKQGREDLAAKEKEEMAVIEKFLPKQLDEAAIKEAVAKIIAETGAASPADMGKVMGAASKALAGQADGKTISAIVKELLSKLAKEGKTIFYCSHMMDVVEKVSNRIILINDGEIIADGSFEELKARQGDTSLEKIFAHLTAKDSLSDAADQLMNAFS